LPATINPNGLNEPRNPNSTDPEFRRWLRRRLDKQSGFMVENLSGSDFGLAGEQEFCNKSSDQAGESDLSGWHD
jgi:hypothetical protein